MHAPPETLVCFAVKDEAQAFARETALPPHVEILITGMGRHNAERGVRAALARRKPALVVTAGFAGGLRPGLKRGTVVFSSSDNTGLEPALLEAGAQPVRFHASDRVIGHPAEKRTLFRDTGADVVEMESFAIKAMCEEHGIPCAMVRVVLDTAEEELPLDFNSVLTEDLRIHGGKLALALAKSPGKIAGLLRLRQHGKVAGAELARVLSAVLRDSAGR